MTVYANVLFLTEQHLDNSQPSLYTLYDAKHADIGNFSINARISHQYLIGGEAASAHNWLMGEDSKWSRSSTDNQITTPQMSVPAAASAHNWLMGEDSKWLRSSTDNQIATPQMSVPAAASAHIIATLLITRLSIVSTRSTTLTFHAEATNTYNT